MLLTWLSFSPEADKNCAGVKKISAQFLFWSQRQAYRVACKPED